MPFCPILRKTYFGSSGPQKMRWLSITCSLCLLVLCTATDCKRPPSQSETLFPLSFGEMFLSLSPPPQKNKTKNSGTKHPAVGYLCHGVNLEKTEGGEDNDDSIVGEIVDGCLSGEMEGSKGIGWPIFELVALD